MKKVFGSTMLIGGLVMGTILMTTGNTNARIFGKKDREVVGVSCKDQGSCAVVINGNTHSDAHALDRIVYN